MALGVAAMALVAATAGGGAKPALMPWPSSIETGSGELAVGPGFRVAVTGKGGPLVERAARRFEARLARQTGLVLPSPAASAEKPALEIRCEGPGRPLPHLGMDESYALTVTPEGATLQAAEPWGVLRGMETFLQLVGPGSSTAFRVPAVVVERPAPFRLAGSDARFGAPLHAGRDREANARRHGGGEAERPPHAPHRRPGLPRGEPPLPGAPPPGLRRPLLHPGRDQGPDRVRGRARHPRLPRVRHPRPHHELVREPPRARLHAGSLRDRARLGDLRPRPRPLEGGGLPLPRRLPRRDGGPLPRPVPPRRGRRGERQALGRLRAPRRRSRSRRASRTTTSCWDTSASGSRRSSPGTGSG